MAVAALLSGVAQAAALVTLTNSDPAAVRQAIEQGGTVQLAFDGVFPINRSFLITTNTTVDASGHSVTFDAGQSDRHFTVTNNASLRLVHLVLVNGRAVGATGEEDGSGGRGAGGSIYSSGGALELIDCRLMNNQATGGPAGNPAGWPTFGGDGAGGALYVADGTAWITNCLFTGNLTGGGDAWPYRSGGGSAMGGAIYSTNSALSFEGVTLSSNQANKGAVSYAGALIALGGSIVMTNCVFDGNEAIGGGARNDSALGGAIFFSDFITAAVERTVFTHNAALGGGGPVGARGAAGILFGSARGGAIYGGSGNMVFRDSAFVSNRAVGQSATNCCFFDKGFPGSGVGGALDHRDELTLINCTFAGNSAVGGEQGGSGPQGPAGGAGGGAINGGHMTLVNVTFARNFNKPAGGALVAGVTTMTNTIFYCAPDQVNVAPPIFDGGHNICSDDSARFTSPTSRENLDPLLGQLGNYGGPTPTVPLLPGSPAIDAGDDAACPPTDQRGVARPQGLACDIGAFELAPSLAVEPGDEGQVRVEYAFQANRTNQVSVSTNLTSWEALGARVSDTNGVFEIEQVDPAKFRERFYKVQIQGPQ